MKKVGIISLVGGDSLIGREFSEIVSESRLPATIKLIGIDEEAATLTEVDGEPSVMTPMDEANLEGASLVVLAGAEANSRKALAINARQEAAPAVIDLTFAAEEEPNARLRAPAVEPYGYTVPSGAVHVVAHPAAIALALFHSRLTTRYKLRRWTVHIFEPASERGQQGLEELRQQTVSLLSFHPLQKKVFDAQLSFNMLARYGDEAPEALESIEVRIERHLATLLAGSGGGPIPSLRLIQAPVFHGYSFSVQAEFEEAPDTDSLAAAISSPEVDVRARDMEPPNNVGIARQGGIAVGSILQDRNNPNAFWFWVVADNLHLMAENAVAVARVLLKASVSGADK